MQEVSPSIMGISARVAQADIRLFRNFISKIDPLAVTLVFVGGYSVFPLQVYFS